MVFILKFLLIINLFMLSFTCVANQMCVIQSFNDLDVDESLIASNMQKPYSLNVIGVIEGENNCFLVYYFEKEFGNKRLAKKLVIFPLYGNYFGQYAIPETPLEIKGKSVHFGFDAESGNSVNLNLPELPKNIYLDSELYGLVLSRKIFKADETQRY